MSLRIVASTVWLGALAFVSPSASAADSNPALEYNRLSRPSDAIGAMGNNLFGDQVDLYNGQASFDVTDISIPGNSKLPVSLGRHLDVAEEDESGPLPSFANWEVDVPYLQAYYTDTGWMATGSGGAGTMQRCSVADVNAGTAPGMVYTDGTGTYTAYGRLYWSGITMHVPGAGAQELLVDNSSSPRPATGGPYYWVTKNLWSLGCVSALSGDTTGQGGEGFVATAPDGTKYYFDVLTSLPAPLSYAKWSSCQSGKTCDWIAYGRSKYFMLASRVVDRFGNWVHYNYTGNKLASITANDGREIDITWGTDGNIQSALERNPSIPSDVSRTWTYSYGPLTNVISSNPSTEMLSGVALPDGSAWAYQYAGSLMLHFDPTPPQHGGGGDGFDPNEQPQCSDVDPTPLALRTPNGQGYGFFTLTASHPSGEQGVFQFQPLIRGLSNVPQCSGPDPWYPWTRRQFAIVSKALSDPTRTDPVSHVVPTSTWTYTYSVHGELYAGQSWAGQTTCSGGPCPTTVWTDVQAPDGTHVQSVFGNQFELTEGQLQEVKTYLGTDPGNVTTVLDDATTSYVGVPSGTSQPYPQFIGDAAQPRANVFLTQELHPQLTHAEVRDGVTFQSTANTFDVYASPLSATRSSTLGYTSTDAATHNDNTSLWVIGQPATLTNSDTGTQVYSKTYDPATALPQTISSYGLLDASYTFFADGNLHTVQDGNSHTTTLGNYYRGVPRSLQYADGTTRTAAVDDFGHITAITDPIGTTPADTTSTTTTSFGYDAMGRLNLITPPAGDSVAWKPTSISFAPVASTEYGLAAGHWKEVECTGASNCATAGAVKVTYFDGQWQPVLTQEYGTANVPATQHFSTKAYDFAGRTSFASSPVASLTSYSDALNGVHTLYDGLGRPTTSTQNSELGTLTTGYAYLAGFVTQVTNPRGYSTSTAYQAFDGPDTSHPTAIVSPEGVTTTIGRDVFGKPLNITRQGTWNGSPISAIRSYVYDTHQRLCKRVEPETGASFASYDAASNIAWTATGSTLTAITSSAQCETDRSAVPATIRTVYGYDPRNRVLTVDVPNSSDDLAYGYYNDGALHTLSNGAGTDLNTWTYAYDLRRLPVTENLAIDGRSSTITHAYDVYGHESQLTWPDGLAITTVPDALGRPTQAATYATGVTYFPNGGMSGFTYGNAIVHSLTQNARELPLRSLDQLPGQGAILDDTYTYDENGNVKGIADGTGGNGNGRTMAYDGLDRLTLTNAPNQWWISATTSYDALDNIRSNQVGNTAAYLDTYSYDTTWRLTGIAGRKNWTLGYDANGNITSKGAGNDSYAFDAANRMTSVTGKESYRYDGYGRRVKVTRSSDGKIDYPVYTMGGQLLTEDDQRSNKTTDYVSLNGSLVGKRMSTIGANSWTKTYEHTDALHSPTYETNASGVLTRTERYTPYGEPSDGTYSQGPGFTGHVTDAATGLTYAQQRFYDPILGRFLSPDPVQADDSGGDFNRYWYANNNPYKFTDADGREAGGGYATGAYTLSGPGVTNAEASSWAGPMAATTYGGPVLDEALAAIGGVAKSITAARSIAAAEEASVTARAAGASGGATTGLVTKAGEIITGASARAGGPGMATNATVQGALDSVEAGARSAFHGCCGEIDAMSKALNSGSKLEGSTMATVRAIGREAGKLMDPCSSCRAVAQKLGVRTVSSAATLTLTLGNSGRTVDEQEHCNGSCSSGGGLSVSP